jgi:hypothetical protein
MATRMQQRRGTATQWTSSNNGDGPILNAGEIGWESDTNKFKIGDGVSYWSALTYFVDATDVIASSLGAYLQDSDVGAASGVVGLNASLNAVIPGSSIIIEGATDNAYETTLTVTDPTADRTITFPNTDGTVITTGNLSDITNIGVFTSTIVMEGSSADDHELTISAGNPTADRTVTFPDETGTVQLRVADVSDTEIGYLNGVTSAIQTQMDAKAPLASPTFTGTVTLPANTISQSMMADDSVGTNEIGGLAVTTAKIADLNVTEGKLADGAVTNAKVSASAAIAQSKIDGLTTDLGLKAPLANPTFTGTVSAAALTLSGDLTVNGTTTTINSTTLSVDDKNIVLGDVATPSDSTADGGGITLKGATDKTLNWVDATDAWTSSEDFNLLTGKVYEIAGTPVLSGSTLGAGVTASSLTSVGTITSGTWNGTTIAVANGGTGITSFGTGVATFLGTPSSANFASMISDEIGTGNVLLSEAATSAQSASYTLVLADKAKVVEMSVGSANNLTVPLNSSVAFPTGTQIHIVQTGSGQTTVVAAGGVTINTATTLKLRAQWSAATLVKRAENTWVLVGDLATS